MDADDSGEGGGAAAVMAWWALLSVLVAGAVAATASSLSWLWLAFPITAVGVLVIAGLAARARRASTSGRPQ